MPFSRGAFVYGEPIVVARRGGAREQEEARFGLERALNELEDRADREALR